MQDLTGTVVAVIDDHEQAREALTALAAVGFKAELFHGDEGRAHLTVEEDDGISAIVKRLVLAFGDEVRILERLDRALAEGASVASVDIEAEEADQVAPILEAHGGHDMWRLGEWTFNRIGEDGSGEG
jgi:hypothetical protein